MNNVTEENVNQRLKLDRNVLKFGSIIFNVVLLDILFFPYIRIFRASLSMLILPLWYIFRSSKINVTNELKLFILLLFFIILSLSVSSIYNQQFLIFNLTNIVILIYGFLYYFYFEWNLFRNNKNLTTILILYLSFVFMLSIIYFINAPIYFMVRSIWTMGGNSIEVSNSLLIHRFTGTFSDPNNLAIMVNAVVYYLRFNDRLSIFQKLYIYIASLFILFMTMSTTGFILYGLFVFIVSFYKLKQFIVKPKIKRKSIVLILILFLILPIILFVMNQLLTSEVIELAFYRLKNSDISSRTTRWVDLLKEKNLFHSIILGSGGTIISNGRIYKPHNGHLHLIYNYGFVSYLIFMYLFFRVRKPFSSYKYALFLLPILLGFTVNVGIYEPRFINLMALLTASYSVVAKKFSRKNEIEIQNSE